MHFKATREAGKAKKEQYLLAVDLGHYKWYQSQTSDDVSVFSLFPEGGRHEACFKALRGSPKGKAQRVQYLLAVNLGRYK